MRSILDKEKTCPPGQVDPEIIQAFHRFSVEIRRIEKEIEKRNADPSCRNRCRAGMLIPSSGPGVTSKGVPNCITL